MLHMKPSWLLVYFGIIVVSIAYVQQGADGYRLKNNNRRSKSSSGKGKFVNHFYGKTGKHTLQSKLDKHKSKRIKPSHPLKMSPIALKPVVSRPTNIKPVVMEAPSKRKNLTLKPVNAKKPERPSKKESTKGAIGMKVFNCPKEAIEMNCLSCKTKVYRKCPVVGASSITDVHMENEYPSSAGRCFVGAKQNFGIVDDNYIWVDKGCRAKFIACYNREIKEALNVDCKCDVTSQHHNCPVGLKGSNIVIKVNMLFSYGKGRCKEKKTWGFDDKKIWVKSGCSATFKVFWS